MNRRWLLSGAVLLALSACAQPSLDNADAAKALDDVAGVERAEADCSNPIEGPSCTLVVHVSPTLDAPEIIAVIEAAMPSLVDDVFDLRIVSDEIAMTLDRGRLDARDVAVQELVAMRGIKHVIKGTIDVRGSGDTRVEAVTDSLDAGLVIATALRSDELPDVTVSGAGLLLIATAGLPAVEFEFARQVPKAFDGVNLMRVVPGQVTAYCSSADVQAAVKAKIESLPGYDAVGKVDVFEDAP